VGCLFVQVSRNDGRAHNVKSFVVRLCRMMRSYVMNDCLGRFHGSEA
jgi:hypothetical protein